MLFQQHPVGIAHFPFFRRPPRIATYGKRSYYTFHERRLDVHLNRKILPIDNEDQPDLMVFF
jgi:hypothetical protein